MASCFSQYSKWIVFLLAMTGMLGMTEVTAAQGVNVFLKEGSPVRGEFVASTPGSIKVKTNSGEVAVSVENIRNITITNEPNEFGRVRRDYENQRFDEGLAELAKISSPPTERLTAEEFEYLRAFGSAMSSMRGGKLSATDAGAAVLAFTKKFPESYHSFEIVEILGSMYTDIGRYDLARQEFEKLANSSVPDIQFRGQFLLGETLLRLGDGPGAETSFQNIISSSQNSAEALRLKTLAQPLLAKSLVLSKNVKEARERVEQIILNENPENQILFANCYNVLGLCDLAEGNLKAAALNFLHTDLLFNSSPDSHAEALYYLTTIWPQLQKNDLAFDARESLQSLYRNSIWAQKLNK